jgi:hypothetical protein
MYSVKLDLCDDSAMDYVIDCRTRCAPNDPDGVPVLTIDGVEIEGDRGTMLRIFEALAGWLVRDGAGPLVRDALADQMYGAFPKARPEPWPVALSHQPDRDSYAGRIEA